MPVDSSIALAGKPPVLPEFDMAKTFLTLGQLKYLQSETLRTEAQAALAGTQGQAAAAVFAEQQHVRDILAGRTPEARRLATIGTPPQPQPGAVAMGGPPVDAVTQAALPQGGSTMAAPAPGGAPPPGSPPASAAPPPRRSRAQMLEELGTAGTTGNEAIKSIYANDEQALKNDKQALETRLQRANIAANMFKDANGQADWDRTLAYIEHVTGQPTDHLPQVFSPEAKAQMANAGRSVQQDIESKQKDVEQRILQQEADTRAATEARMNRKDIPVPMAQGPPKRFREFGPDTPDEQGTPTEPDDPGMTLEQGQQRASHEGALHGEFRNETEQYDRIRNGLALVRNAQEVNPKDPRATDQVLLNGFAELIGGASNPRLTTVLNPEQRNSLMGRLEQYRDQLLKGASLSPGQRADILKASEDVAKTQIANYDKIKDNYRTRAKGIPNTRPEVIAPDFVQSGPTASGSAPQWTPANVAELKRGFIAAGNTPAQAEALTQQILRATPAPASPSAPPTQGRVGKPGGVSGGTPAEVAAVIARFRDAGETNPSMRAIRGVIKHAHDNGLGLLTGGMP